MKYLLILSIVFSCCKTISAAGDASIWKKVKIDFRKFDSDGLAGPENGKIAANYEFCIPQSEKLLLQVRKIDPTAVKTAGKGRVACSDSEWLIIGSTHQKQLQWVLYQLASLSYVKEIQETFFE
jgi:hypothetical protein